jgi:hypothetical protein
VVSLAEALALLGLQLRLKGSFDLGPDLGRFDRGMFYWVLARELLPGAWRCCTACMASARTTGDDEFEDLALMPVERFDRALRARDRFHGHAKRWPTTRTAADEALFFFETALLYLSAAFDALARIVDRVYGLGRQQSSWRWADWRNRLRAQDAALADFMEPTASGGATLATIQLLRNTIHGPGMRVITQQGHFTAPTHLVEVPDHVLAKLVPAVELLGGAERWGLTDLANGRSYLDCEPYLEAAFEEAARALDELLQRTAVERLPGVAAPDGDPPRDGPFAPEFRARTRLLGGFA